MIEVTPPESFSVSWLLKTHLLSQITKVPPALSVLVKVVILRAGRFVVNIFLDTDTLRVDVQMT